LPDRSKMIVRTDMDRRRVEKPERFHGTPDAVRRTGDRGLNPAVGRILALQRTAGNAVVARLVARSRRTLAREGDDDSLASLVEEPGHNPYRLSEALLLAMGARMASVGRVRDAVLPPSPSNPLRGARGGYDPEPEEVPAYGISDAPPVGYAPARGPEVDSSESSLSDDEPEVDSEDSLSGDEPEGVPAAPPAIVNYTSGRGGGADSLSSDSESSLSEDDASVASPRLPVAPRLVPGASPQPRARSASVHGYDTADEGDVADIVPVAPPSPTPRRRKKGFLAAIKRAGERLKKLFKPRQGRGVRAQDLLADDRDLAAPEEEFAISSSLEENRALPKKYADLAKMIGHGDEEKEESTDLVNHLMEVQGGLWYDMLRVGLAQRTEKPEDILADPTRVRNGLMKVWGWSAEDVAKYYDPVTGKAQGTKVKYIRSPAELATYAVKLGPTLTYGRPRRTLDTEGMVSKASGPGWGIFVMDAQGRVYVGQHRVGLFHHSSFTAGGDVAAAGEMKVTRGKLVGITAKSGHYEPNARQTRQMLDRLAGAGCPLAGVECKVWIPHPNPKIKVMTVVYDADDLLRNGDGATILRHVHQMA
jgi:hypothetical protein